MTSIKKVNKKSSNKTIILSVLVVSILTILVFSFNMVSIYFKKSTVKGKTLEIDKNSSISNSQYVIGNNPTSLLRENFKELTASLKENDPLKITEYVTKCFVIDYFTWTNKDGNYEVGGLQYIYGPKFTSFSEESRYGFYSDLDLFIKEYGRENLLEVESFADATASVSNKYTVNGKEYDAYYIELEWKYKKSSKIDVDEFQHVGYFTVINNDGRYEIVSMYDKWD